MSLGFLIKTYREKRGLSQQKLAEKLGVEQQTVFKYERNEHDFPISRAREIQKVLDIPITEMCRVTFGEGRDNPEVRESSSRYDANEAILKYLEHVSQLEPDIFRKMNLKLLLETIASLDKSGKVYFINAIHNIVNLINSKEKK